MSQNMNWNDVFGEEMRGTPNKLSLGHFELSLQDSQQANERIKNSIGQHLFDHIKQSNHLIHSSKIAPAEKKQLRESHDFFINITKNDMAILEDTQLLFITTKPILYRINPEQQQHFNTMLRLVDKLITNYSGKLKKLHLHAPLKTCAALEIKTTADMHKKLLSLIQSGDLKNALVILLGYHNVYTQEQSAALFNAAKTFDFEHTEAFIELLSHRLYSEHSKSPDQIDYGALQHNFFLTDKSILPHPQNMLFFLNPTLEGLVHNKHEICEIKTKQQLSNLVEEFNSFIDAIARSIAPIENKLRL